MWAVGGLNVDIANNIEIFDFKTNTSCYGTNFPRDIREPIVAYTSHRVVICGGKTLSSLRTIGKECFTLDSYDQKWYPLQEMEWEHYEGASTVLHGGDDLWVIGGQTRERGDINSERHWTKTEIFTKGGYWAKGPDAPFSPRDSCLVNIDENRTALIGGSYEFDAEETEKSQAVSVRIFNWNTQVLQTYLFVFKYCPCIQ